MPVYQYACTECGEQLEVRQSFTDDALTVCPVCTGRLRKVLSAVGVVFKGSGFYRTDSRNGAPVPSADTQKGSDAAASSKDSASGSGSDSSPSTSSSGTSSNETGSSSSSSSSTPKAPAAS